MPPKVGLRNGERRLLGGAERSRAAFLRRPVRTPGALPLTADQIQLLIEAAQADWRDVEPTIFGTLLVRALDPAERHKLRAHFTPRAYVDRLVLPTIEVSPGTRPLLRWPARMAEQAQDVRAALAQDVRAALAALGGPASAAQVAAAFDAAPAERVAELLETLVTLGQARQTDEGRFVG